MVEKALFALSAALVGYVISLILLTGLNIAGFISDETVQRGAIAVGVASAVGSLFIE